MINDIAIVIGSSMAGLLAARSLSEQYEIVIILERDKITEKLNCHDGLAQASHTQRFHQVMCQVVAIPNVCLVDNAPVHTLCIDYVNNRVTGVVFDDRRANRVETLPCGIVVDATGSAPLLSNIDRAKIKVEDLEQYVNLTNADMQMRSRIVPLTKSFAAKKVSNVARRLHVYRNYADIKPAYDIRGTHTMQAYRHP